MPSQDNFQHVTDFIIKPIERHFGCAFDAETINDYVSDLGRFTADTLRSAMSDLRKESKRRPTLASILEKCRYYQPPVKEGNVNNPHNPIEKIHHNNTLADRVMRSPIGRLALSLGVAQSVWMYAWRDSVEITEERRVYQIRDAWKNAIDVMVKMDTNSNLYNTLNKYYDTIKAKELELNATYAHQLQSA